MRLYCFWSTTVYSLHVCGDMVDHLAHLSLDSNKPHLYIRRTIMTAAWLLRCPTYSPFAHSRFTFHSSPPRFVCAVKADFYRLYQVIFVIVVVWPFACQLCSANGRHGSDIRMKRERLVFSSLYVPLCWIEDFIFNTCFSIGVHSFCQALCDLLQRPFW